MNSKKEMSSTEGNKKDEKKVEGKKEDEDGKSKEAVSGIFALKSKVFSNLLL